MDRIDELLLITGRTEAKVDALESRLARVEAKQDMTNGRVSKLEQTEQTEQAVTKERTRLLHVAKDSWPLLAGLVAVLASFRDELFRLIKP